MDGKNLATEHGTEGGLISGILKYGYFGRTVRIWLRNMVQGGTYKRDFIIWLLWLDGKDLATERGTRGWGVAYKGDFIAWLLWLDGKDLATEHGTRGDL